MMSAHTEEVNGWTIGYYRYGNGPNPMLLLPGALGTSQSDFWHQLQGRDAFDATKFTVIAADAPGWGNSRSRPRPYGPDVYDIDVECMYQLMKKLGFDKFFVVGWSDGSRVAILMAAKYPEDILGVVVHGVMSVMTPRLVRTLKAVKDVRMWGPMLDDYLRSYENEDVFQKLWDRHLQWVDSISSLHWEKMNNNSYNNIKAPLLLIHGDQDVLSTIDHPQNVMKQVKHAKLHRMAAGHDLHKKFSGQYKKLVEDFLLSAKGVVE